jgi:hypothetical protein
MPRPPVRTLAATSAIVAVAFAGSAAGAGRAAHRVRVTVISDSVGASLLFNPRARAALGRTLDWQLEMEACRRLASPSCTVQGTAGPPPSALDTVRGLPTSLGKILVVFVGYNEDGTGYARGIDELMRSARARGVQRVVWLTLSERSSQYHYYYHLMNRTIRAAHHRWPRLSVADWNAFSAGHPWFNGDGVHLTNTGSVAFARFVRSAVKDAKRRL